MKWRRVLLCSFAAVCLLASVTACGGSSSPYARSETTYRNPYPPGYNPGYNPRGPGRHSMGHTSYGRPRRRAHRARR